MSVARSSWFAISSSYQRRSIAARSLAVRAAQAGQRRRAASMARRVSAAPITGTVPMHFAGRRIDHRDGSPHRGVQPLPADEGAGAQQLRITQFHGSVLTPSFAGPVARPGSGRETRGCGCAPARQPAARSSALVAVEAVAGTFVEVHDRGSGCSAPRVASTSGSGMLWSCAPIVVHDRTARLLLQVRRHALAVVHHRAAHRQLAGRQIGQRAAPTVTNRGRAAGVAAPPRRRRRCPSVVVSGLSWAR